MQLKGSINNNADDVINLTVDDRDEEPMEEDSPRQNMAEKLGLCFSDESDADDENNPATRDNWVNLLTIVGLKPKLSTSHRK